MQPARLRGVTAQSTATSPSPHGSERERGRETWKGIHWMPCVHSRCHIVWTEVRARRRRRRKHFAQHYTRWHREKEWKRLSIILRVHCFAVGWIIIGIWIYLLLFFVAVAHYLLLRRHSRTQLGSAITVNGEWLHTLQTTLNYVKIYAIAGPPPPPPRHSFSSFSC